MWMRYVRLCAEPRAVSRNRRKNRIIPGSLLMKLTVVVPVRLVLRALAPGGDGPGDEERAAAQ